MMNQNSWSGRGRILLLLVALVGACQWISFASAEDLPVDPAGEESKGLLPLLNEEVPIPSPLEMTAEERILPVPTPRDQNAGNRTAPETLPETEQAVPLPGNTVSQYEMIRKFIDVDLKDASEQEKEVWFELLKDEPPSLARNLLNLRKNFGSSFTPSVLDLDSNLPSDLREEGEEMEPQLEMTISPTPLNPAPAGLDLDSPELEPLKRQWTTVRGMALFNISQLHLPGYKRLEFVSANTESNEEAAYTELVEVPAGSYRLDLRQGELEETGGELDIALQGTGWLKVTDVESGDSGYTRGGSFSRDAEGRLMLFAGGHEFLLDPEITLPVEVSDITISDTGVISGTVEQSETEFGQLQITRFPNAASLRYAGEGIYVPTVRSGRPVVAKPPAGLIHQGHLEMANVSQQTEFSKLDRYYQQWQTGLRLMSEFPLIPSE